MASETPVWKGWAGLDEQSTKGNLVFEEFEPKAWEEDDIEVKVLYCGICGSDHGVLSGEWGPVTPHTICGHEVAGSVVRVGSKVEKGIKVGDIVGIGWQSDACLECEFCKSGLENHCAQQVATIMGKYYRGNAGKAGSTPKGGFAKYWRGPSRFAIPIPKEMDPAVAAPLLCGGITTYRPLAQWKAGTERKRVGVIGVGGLGHMGIQFARALGAEVTAISRSDSKKADAEQLGATKFLATGSDVAAACGSAEHARSLDLILCTINPPDFKEITDYLKLLAPQGQFVLLGVPSKPLSIPAFSLIGNAVGISGSNIGSPALLEEMLQFAAKHDVKPWIQKYDMDNINQAMPDFEAGKPRYRFVLVNTDNGGKM